MRVQYADSSRNGLVGWWVASAAKRVAAVVVCGLRDFGREDITWVAGGGNVRNVHTNTKEFTLLGCAQSHKLGSLIPTSL